MPIHVAITRVAKPGKVEAFQEALRQFFQASFDHPGVLGVLMLPARADSDDRVFGIIRTFADEASRDAFYSSSFFTDWMHETASLTEGDPQIREMHGLEAWFSSPGLPAPRWKMALVTLCGAYPTILILYMTVVGYIVDWPMALRALTISSLMVVLLTWLVMPLMSRLFRFWLRKPARVINSFSGPSSD